jgi:outer membrane protein, adhesin transport system
MRPLLVCQFLGVLLYPFHVMALPSSELKVFLGEVLQTHPDVKVQQSNLAVSIQEVSIAQQQFWPTPSLSMERVQANAGDSQYQGDPQVAVFRLQQPLWTGGRLSAVLEKARSVVQVREAAVAESRLQLALTTVENWGAWCSAEGRMRAVERSYALHQSLRARVSRRVDEGASAKAELVMTDGRVAQTALQLQNQKTQSEAARSRLAQLLGKPMPYSHCPEWTGLMPLNAMSLQELTDGSLDKHPFLLRLRAQIQQAKFEVEERKADLWPEVFLRAERQYGNSSLANAPATNRVFVGFNTRLGAGASTFQQIDASLQKVQAAEQEVLGAQRKVTEQLESVWIQLQDVQQRLPALNRQAESNMATQEAWTRQFLEGRKSWLEVMNAARESMQAEIDLADALVNEKSLQWRLSLFVQGVDEVLSVNP